MSDPAKNLEQLDWKGDSLVHGWVGEVAPTLADLTTSFVFGEVYAQAQLSPRERELVITAILAATGAFPDGMAEHAELARKAGATDGQVDALFALVAAYAGFPRAISAARDLQARRRAASPRPG